MSQGKNRQISATAGFVALGSNVQTRFGDAQATLVAALSAMEAAGIRIAAKSGLYRTPSFPAGSGPDFANAVVAIDTDGTPQTLMAALHRIEAAFARERDARWAPRTLDLDLLAWDDLVLPNRDTCRRWIDLSLERQLKETPQTLIVPHPRLQDRAFVLVPFADIAPDWRHPVLGKNVREMLNKLPQDQRAAIRSTAWPGSGE